MLNRVSKCVAVALAVGVLLALTLAGLRCSELILFARNRDSGLQFIETLRDRRPADISTNTWNNALTWTKTAYSNVFFSCDSVSSVDIVDFNREARSKFTAKADLQSFDWAWERLARSSPFGEEYTGKFKHEYFESTGRNLGSAQTRETGESIKEPRRKNDEAK